MSWFDAARSYFAKQCDDKQLYYTLCLLGAAELSINKSLPALAAMSSVKDIKIMFRPDAEELFKTAPRAFCFVMFHEIRHIIQCSSMLSALELPDLSPLVVRGMEMEAQAEDQESKDRWRKWTEQLADRKNPIVLDLLRSAINIGMDAAVNRDAAKIWGKDTQEALDAFLLKGKETDGKIVGTVTVEKLEKMMDTHLASDAEWLYYTNEYLKHIANQIQDPNDAPQPMFSGVDTHEGHGSLSEKEEEQAEAQKTIQDACDRAEKEAKLRASKAGKDAGDLSFTATMVPLNKKIQKLIEKLRFKVKKILSPSPEEIYTFGKRSRLWPNSNLPGTENIQKHKHSVVLVIDTSGSCWNDDWLNQTVAVARLLHKKGSLLDIWTFDTELARVTYENNKAIMLQGGGGTEWQEEFTDRILSTAKAKRMDILLLSDMEITNLNLLENDPRVHLHAINITEYLLK